MFESQNTLYKSGRLLGGTLLLVTVLVGAVGTAFGQTEAEAETEEALDEVVVYGQKLAEILAIGAKRRSRNISEAMSQDDMGQFADNNLGETLGRISGVSTVLDEGVGRYITIRGLNPEFVKVNIDGAGFGSTPRPWEDPGRAANMEAISPDFIGQIEVFKSVTADMDGDAIGGTVNFVSRSAYDMKLDEGQKVYFVVDAAGGDNSSDDAPFSSNDNNFRLKSSLSALFGTNDQFGIVLTGSAKDEDKDVFKRGIHSWGGTSLLPSGNLAPNGVWDTLIHEEGEKRGASGKFEFRPSETFEAALSVIYSDEDQEWNNGGHQLWRSGDYDEAAGTITDWAYFVTHKWAKFGTDSTTYNLRSKWNVGDRSSLEFIAMDSSSESYLDEPRAKWVVGWDTLDGTYTANGRNYSFDLDEASDTLVNDPANYTLDEVRDKFSLADTDVQSFALNWATNMDGEDGSFGFKAGVKRTEQDYSFTERFIRAQKYQLTEEYNSFINAYDYTPPSSSNRLLFADVPGFVQQIENEHGSITEFAEANFTKFKGNYTNAKDLETEEVVQGAYALISYFGDNWDTIVGLRYEKSDWDGQNRVDSEQDAPFVAHGGDYSDVLPSAVLNFNVTDSTKVRVAYSETIGRPGMTQYAAFESEPNETTGQFFRSNPDLLPRESRNIDLSFEKYIADGTGMFAIGYFNKDIKNEIYDQRVGYLFDNGVDLIDSFFTQPQNAGSAKVSGFETSFVLTTFDFLPEQWQGLGLRFNWTVQDSELKILDDDGNVSRVLNRLPQSPDDLYNLVFTFEDYGFDARLAYQYQGARTIRVAEGSDSTEADDLVRTSTERVDLHIGYQLTDTFNAYVDVWNLTEEETFDQGNAFWDEFTQYGRAYWVGLKARW